MSLGLRHQVENMINAVAVSLGLAPTPGNPRKEPICRHGTYSSKRPDPEGFRSDFRAKRRRAGIGAWGGSTATR